MKIVNSGLKGLNVDFFTEWELFCITTNRLREARRTASIQILFLREDL